MALIVYQTILAKGKKVYQNPVVFRRLESCFQPVLYYAHSAEPPRVFCFIKEIYAKY